MNKEVNQQPIWKSVYLHLLPGIIFTIILYFACTYIRNESIPKALIFYSLALIILVPLFLILIKVTERKEGVKKPFYKNISYLEKLPVWKVITLGCISLVWAILVFVLGKQLNLFLQVQYFSWMGNTFDITDYIMNPENYTKSMLVITWVAGLISTSIIVPVFEEIYFRGYLLPGIDRYKIIAPILSAILFSLYHFFTPWMLPVRIIAILPMTILVWRYKNIHIAIICHVLLNLTGDSISTIPIIFN